MSNTVSGELNSMSAWVTFKDRHDVTHVLLRENVRRSLSSSYEVVVHDGPHVKVIATQLPYDEIMST